MRSMTGESRESTIPYYFSDLARGRQQDIQVGDYVRVRGLDQKCQLMDIFPRLGSVLVREIGSLESMTVPWNGVSPWKNEVIRSKTVMQTIGDWLSRGSRVYLLSEPHRMLKQRKIHWDRQTCDVESEDGTMFYDVPWGSLEFWDPVDYNLPDDNSN
ncbi:MAG: hypothetical protein WBG50_24590 [Desulfomonilaceae bacterium]